jgi:protein-S-isoprenylcysteine O-methyltransferase Ste14
MLYVALAVMGIIVVHFCDPAALRKIPVVKPVVWVVGVGLVTYATVRACLLPDKVVMPYWTALLGWTLLSISLALVIYSLFISLPFRKTYVNTGVGSELVTTGFYALTRHPGVLWTVLLMIALILTSKSRLLLQASPLFVVLDLLVVIIQDRYYFNRMFPGYAEYSKRTPMLVPNTRSFRAFWDSATPPFRRAQEGKNASLS